MKSAGDNQQLCLVYCINIKIGAYNPDSGFNNALYSSKLKSLIIKDAIWKENVDSVQIVDKCFKNVVPNIEKCSIEFLKSRYCFWKEIIKYCPADLRNHDFC